jgi:hypothetical protein
VVAGLVAVTGAVSIASASAGSAGDDKGRTLVFRTTVVSSSVNDAGHGGVADVTAVLFSMQRPDGSAAGQGWISCVNILATDQLCHAAFVLSGGQIEAQAEIPMAATTFTAAITGGTGAFEGVSGRDRPDLPSAATPSLSGRPSAVQSPTHPRAGHPGLTGVLRASRWSNRKAPKGARADEQQRLQPSQPAGLVGADDEAVADHVALP